MISLSSVMRKDLALTKSSDAEKYDVLLHELEKNTDMQYSIYLIKDFTLKNITITS